LMLGTLAAAPAGALDNELFGLRLGAELKIPECPRQANAPSSDEGVPAVTMTSACYKPKQPAARGRLTGAFDYEMPYANWPGVANDLSPIVGYAIDGRVEHVEFRTFGIRNGEEVLRFLEKKYGKPAQLQRENVKTSGGVTFQSIRAGWRSPALFVDFDSARENLDLGSVRVYTKKYAAPAAH
jgi:hypothetical protein